ncbi:MAG: hypothetical protein ACE5EX_11395, partial [Phycisphaerae bacterium]
GAAQVGRYFHDDELIVEVTMEVALDRVVTKLKELHAEHYRGRRVTTLDISRVTKTLRREMIRATGSGVPPARYLKAARTAGIDMPDWLPLRLRATGEATDPRLDTAQGKLRAARAARLDALRKLSERVYDLTIHSGTDRAGPDRVASGGRRVVGATDATETTIREFVGKHGTLAVQLEAVIAGAVADRPTFTDDTVTVTVHIPAGDVWSVIHRQMLILRRRG